MTLRNVKEVEATGLPRLSKCVLPTAFKCVRRVEMEDAGKLEENELLRKALEESISNSSDDDIFFGGLGVVRGDIREGRWTVPAGRRSLFRSLLF